MYSIQAVSEPAAWERAPLLTNDGVRARDDLATFTGNGYSDTYRGPSYHQSRGFLEPLIEDAFAHLRAPLYQLEIGQRRIRKEGTYQFIRIGHIPVATFTPRNMTPYTPVVYVNTGGVIELLFIFRDWIILKALRSRPHGLYWVNRELAHRYVNAGYALWHATGADIEHPGITHRATIAEVAKLRVQAILAQMRRPLNFPQPYRLFWDTASIGSSSAAHLLASGDRSFGRLHGWLSTNGAFEFTDGAALELKLENLLKYPFWGKNQLLPPLLPNGDGHANYHEWLQEGLRRVNVSMTPVIFLSTIAPDDPRRAGSPVERILAEVFGTPNTDWAVNPLMARGLGIDGKALIPGAVSIVIKGIDHFMTRHHELMNQLHEDLMRLMVAGERMHYVDVEVNGVPSGKLGDYKPTHPLMLQSYGDVIHDIVHLGASTSAGRLLRRLYADNLLRVARMENGHPPYGSLLDSPKSARTSA